MVAYSRRVSSGTTGLAARPMAPSRPAGSGPVPSEGGNGLTLLLVEDDESLGSQLERGLARAGYQVRRVTSGEAALSTAHMADLVLLDLGLPDLDGTEVCRLLRERFLTPIIVVTARGEEPERVAVLDLGADDYLVKPFGFAELLARIRAVLRRSRPGGPGAAELAGSSRVRVDLRARRVYVDGTEVSLTPKEFDILACLAEDPGRAVSREEIFERAWDAHWYGPTKVLDVHVAALRRKLGDPQLIQTVYGVGFRLDPAKPGETPR